MTVYNVTTLGNPSANGSTSAFGINAAGQIVGTSFNTTASPISATSHGFLYNSSDGSYTAINEPFALTSGIGVGTWAQGINDKSEIVGYYTGLFSNSGPSGTFGFLYSGGTYTNLNAPGSTNKTLAFGINNAGQIAGYYSVGSVNHGFVYSSGNYTTLDDPLAGPTGTFAYGINNANQIVGSYNDASGHSHGFFYSGGSFTTLDDPSGTDTVATGVNDAGQIVGHYLVGSIQHSFLYSAGAYIPLDPLAAWGINSSGILVGTSGGLGFFAVPGPNPLPPPGTSANMVLRGANASSVPGLYQIYNIGNNAILASYSLGQAGTDFGFVTLGGFNDGDTSDMLLRNVNTGGLLLYDISNNQITGSFFLGNIGLDWQYAGVGPMHGAGTSDLVLRNVNTGAFQTYNIAGNTLVGSTSLGAAGLDWQLGGFAAYSARGATGSSDHATAQLIQAMAGFGGGSGGDDTLNTVPIGADTSQQTLLTAPQHA